MCKRLAHATVQGLGLALAIVLISMHGALASPPSAPGSAFVQCQRELVRIGLDGPDARITVKLDARLETVMPISVDLLLDLIVLPEICRAAGIVFVARIAHDGHYGVIALDGLDGASVECRSGAEGGTFTWLPLPHPAASGHDTIAFRLALARPEGGRIDLGELWVDIRFSPLPLLDLMNPLQASTRGVG